MKRLWFIAILAASGSACVEGNNPVQLVDVKPFTAECTPANLSLTEGFLNFDLSHSYVTTISLASPLQPQSGSSGVGFVAEEIIYNYESANPKTSFSEESRRIFLAVGAGTQAGQSWVGVNLIGTEAAQKLDSVVPTSPEVMTLLATVKLKGKLTSGREVETNELTYPIYITREGGCPVGQSPVGEGACSNPGQDGNGFTCQ
ncbi:MAG: hypothetical protein JXB05_12540 [Myxococcaceae bacterium]|nr:hypothetical protein [Myxococcaceae bacterium]